MMDFPFIVGQARRALAFRSRDQHLLDDLVQEVLIASWKKWRDETPPPSWIRRVATRQFFLHLRRCTRRMKREQEYSRQQDMLRSSGHLDPEQQVARTEILEGIFGPSVRALGSLGLESLAGLARTVGLSKGTVYRRIFDFRHRSAFKVNPSNSRDDGG